MMGARDISDELIVIVGRRLCKHMTKASKHFAVVVRAGWTPYIHVTHNDCRNS